MPILISWLFMLIVLTKTCGCLKLPIKSALWLDLTHSPESIQTIFRHASLAKNIKTFQRLQNLRHRDFTTLIDSAVYNTLDTKRENLEELLTPTNPRQLNQFFNYRVLEMMELDTFQYSRLTVQRKFTSHIWEWTLDVPRNLLMVYMNENDFLIRASKLPLSVIKTVMGKKIEYKIFSKNPDNLKMFLSLSDRVIVASNVFSLLKVSYPSVAPIFKDHLETIFDKISSFAPKKSSTSYFDGLLQIIESVKSEKSDRPWYSAELIRKLWTTELVQLVEERKEGLFQLQCARYYRCKRLFRLFQFSAWTLEDEDSILAYDFADFWSHCWALLEPSVFTEFLQRTPLIRGDLEITTSLIKNNLLAENCYAADLNRTTPRTHHSKDTSPQKEVFSTQDRLHILSKASTKPGSLMRNPNMHFTQWRQLKAHRKHLIATTGDVIGAWRKWVVSSLEMFLNTFFKTEYYTRDFIPVLRLQSTSHPSILSIVARLLIKSHQLRLKMPFVFDTISLQKIKSDTDPSDLQATMMNYREDLRFTSKDCALSAGFPLLYSLPQMPSLDQYMDQVTTSQKIVKVHKQSGYTLLTMYGRICRNIGVDGMTIIIIREYSIPNGVEPGTMLNWLTGNKNFF